MQQRRTLCVSQLRSICLRHLSFTSSTGASDFSAPKMGATGESLGEVELPDLFVRLAAGATILYESDVAKETLNPTWPPVELDERLGNTISPYEFLQDSVFELIVYRYVSSDRKPYEPPYVSLKEEDDEDEDDEDEDDDTGNGDDQAKSTATDESDGRHDMRSFEEVLRFVVQLDALEPLHCDYRDLYGLPLNTLILGFQLDKDSEQYFVPRDTMLHLVQSGAMNGRRRKEGILRETKYSLPTAALLLNTSIGLLAEIEQRKRSIEAKRERIAQQLAAHEAAAEKVARYVSMGTTTTTHRLRIQEQQRLRLQNRILALRKEVDERKQAQSRVKSVVKVEKQLLQLDERIPRTLVHLMDIHNKASDERSGIWERRTEVLKVAHKIRSKQAHLVVQLHDIYPISYVGAGEYCIGGIKFMNADVANGKDDEMLSTALGYIAHFVFMLAKYLDVNLRYTIVHCSSRSFMRDDVNDPYIEYPLFKRGVEKDRFEKACVFLKKDVEQLMQARGLDIVVNSQLLIRLKSIVDAEVAWLQANSSAASSS
ncbi:hypothetical protein SPRG_07074 [Saprolegnia parasitica CBS 223.65]|uniref:Uncharacterized protein n=1 Tax=Saprolegnia parasitica (strain CBS 223.65) TaxID=695850 RepID=A0A067CE77_SAPPC|nr:hypothetical protein SPRG_07074 [Saprolegnia parasitica CBS 223.65]KDO27485.1 hypothetical protein SPRG_07074 [Saprolegnia parasitica CBS 223.65]|eukprot:XP_012201920.1 hypothetical protein SPRG_07074 [Saprolegnia parasitica CBS 223.65]